MTGPATPAPPPGPGRPATVPLDPDSAKGREVAERFGEILAQIELEMAEAQVLAAPERRAA